jgi:hypothetical protein
MSFELGQRVKLNRNLQMVGFTVRKGSVGTVSIVHLQTSVLFDGLDQQLVVSDSDIEPAGAPAALTPVASRSVSPANGAAGHSPGERVRSLATMHVAGQTIPAGSAGTVAQDAPIMNAAWVLFDGFSTDVLTPNSMLTPA